jgi:ABC-type lipoprotein export system ATPase subunit
VTSDTTNVVPLLTVRNVTKRFRRGPEVVVAVDDVSFSVVAGRLTVLQGPSGSGKTTLLDVVLGWTPPDDGSVDGMPDPLDWAELAVIPQRLGLLDSLTLGENVELPIRSTRSPLSSDRSSTLRSSSLHSTSEVARSELVALGMGHLYDRYPHESSLGEQQRAACARAVVARPRMIVADEPTSHQDERSARRIVDRLLAAVGVGCAVLVATHDRRIVDVADDVLHLHDGALQPVDDSC